MITDIVSELIEEERIKAVEALRDRLASLRCSVGSLNTWTEKVKKSLQSR